MKRRNRHIMIGLAAVVFLVGGGIASSKRLARIDLSSGRMRVERKAFWITLHRSTPEPTTLSLALTGPRPTPEWRTVAEEGFSFPRPRIDFCYPKMFFLIGAVDHAFNNERVTAITAQMTLEELTASGDTCLLSKHLERFWNSLGAHFEDSWTDSMIASEIPRIWQKTLGEPAPRE